MSGPSYSGQHPLREGPFLFEADGYRFFDDGEAQSYITYSKHRWCVSSSQPDVAMVYWEWGDGTMSLAHENVQQGYRAWLASLIVT